jgi:hypothetical protein
LREALSNLGSFDANYRITSRVVIDWAPEHFGADHALSEGIDIACQCVFDDEMEEILGAFAAYECMACSDLIEVMAH